MEDNGGDAAAAAVPSASTTADNTVADGGAGNIKIKVSHGSNNFDVSTSPQSTFADLKRAISIATGLDPTVQNLLFRGKENDDEESLHMAGVKDNAKVILTENLPAQDEDDAKVEEINWSANDDDVATVEEIKENFEEISRGLEAVNLVREENNQFAEQVVSLETVVSSGTQVADKDFIFLTEMLMRQLLKLDGIDSEGEGRIQRKLEVRRVQAMVDKLDDLRAKNSQPANDVPETAKNSQPASDVPETPDESSSSKVTQDWETFE